MMYPACGKLNLLSCHVGISVDRMFSITIDFSVWKTRKSNTVAILSGSCSYLFIDFLTNCFLVFNRFLDTNGRW